MLLINLVAIVVIATLAFFLWKYQYWRLKSMPYLRPAIPFGNLHNMFNPNVNLGVHFKNIYDDIKRRGWRHCGLFFFTAPVYCPTDLDLLKNILTKDFQYFTDRGTYHNERDDPLTAHLFAVGGTKWRTLRTKLTPTFTSGKLKSMFQTLLECRQSLEDTISRACGNGQPMDIKEALACFTTDVIGSCAFGLECNTFKEQDSPFRRYAQKLVGRSNYRNFRLLLAESFPEVARTLGVIHIPKDVSSFYMDIVNSTVQYREDKSIMRKDFMQLLIDLKHGDSLNFEEIAAQCFVFFIAGFETSSTTMDFVLYELAKHQEVQQQVREEIRRVLAEHDGQITYDAMHNLKYMSQVIDETLRKYPPVPFITRECVKDYKVPGHDLVIDKGTKVLIPILGIQNDQEYYPNPDKFDPDRFSDEQKSKRNPYAYIPFGEGPRICIGMRFGLLQTKVGLITLLKDYNFTLSPKTKEPLMFARKPFFLGTKETVWLNVGKAP